MSDKPLPNPVYKFKEDADFQISAAKEYFNSNFSQNPSGFWPSEGSISNEVLNLMIKNGIKWVATDEEILHNSLNHKQHHLDKYFPWIYENENGEQISIIFRDHYLSDSIGFQYSRWNPFDAANDFIGKILNIRNELINNFGGDILDKACIPIILDGENCWEFYKENGVHFLRELYKQLSENDLIETITFSESLNYCDRKLQSVTAGSWINANFNIWMGHSEHIEAWSMLGRIRNLIETKKNVITLDKYKEALKIIYIAEGSDWFWWYGDSHFAPNKYDFDVLFRYHIAKIHEIIGEEIPMNVYEPISLVKKADLIIYPIEKISPELDDDLNWDNSGIINVKLNMSTMHQIGEILDSVNFQFDDLKFYLRLGFARKLNNNDNIEIDFNGEKLIYSIDSISKSDQDFAFNYNDYLYFLKNLNENKICKISIKIINSDGTILYPWQGEYKINL
jgi:alpha-amylase/alpha-mannosidase (GH57 family)